MNLGTVTTSPRVMLRRGKLDRLIAEGADPTESPGARLSRGPADLDARPPRPRRRLAPGAGRGRGAAGRLFLVGSLRRREILSARALINELAAHLDADDPVTPRGVALVERLLTFGGSPLYAPHPDGALEADLRHARAALLLAA